MTTLMDDNGKIISIDERSDSLIKRIQKVRIEQLEGFIKANNLIIPEEVMTPQYDGSNVNDD